MDVPDFPIADTNQLSLSAWIYSWNIERDCIIAGEMVPIPLNKSDTWQFVVELHPFYNLIVDVNPRNRGYAAAMEGDTKPFPRAQWQHVAFVADGSMLHVYHNGVETASAPCEGVVPARSPKHFSIGAIWAWNPECNGCGCKAHVVLLWSHRQTGGVPSGVVHTKSSSCFTARRLVEENGATE